MPTVLRGERVVLRDFLLSDLEAYARWLGPDHEWRRFDGPYFPPPSEFEIRGTVEGIEAQIRSGNWPTPRRRMVVADASSDLLVGTVARYWICRASRWLGAGIDLYDPQHWGRGFGREALGLWCTYLFVNAPTLSRLELQTWSGNERMMRLAQRLGFTLEARYRDAREVDGRKYDAIGYGVLREEWLAR